MLNMYNIMLEPIKHMIIPLDKKKKDNYYLKIIPQVQMGDLNI